MEESIIMSALTSNERLYALLEYPEEIFTQAKPRIIRRALQEMVDEIGGADLPSLHAKLEARGELQKVGEQYLAGLAMSPVCSQFDYTVRLMDKERRKKEISAKMSDLRKMVLAGADDDIVLETFLGMMKPSPDEPMSIQEMAGLPLDEVFKKTAYVQSGIRSLDDKLVGLFGGQLIVVAARPKKGKSAMTLQIVSNTGGMLFSLEMTKEEIYSRLLSTKASVEAWRIESGKLSQGDTIAITKARYEIAGNTSLVVYDTVNDASKIYGIIRRACEKAKPPVIVIDYLQLIRGSRGDTQNLRIAAITGTLKGLAMKYGVPIILLSQLSRDAEKQNRAPMLSDLRDSGAIEQDADVVLFIHEEADGHQIIVGANRKGRTGKIKIGFNKPYTRFEEV